MKITSPALLSLALGVLTSSTATAAENYSPIRFELGLIGAFAPSGVTGAGPGASMSLKYNVLDQLAVGLRAEADAIIGTAPTDQSASGRGQYVFSLKADYFLTNDSFRPFVGLGLGYYTIAAVTAQGTGGSAEASKSLGMSPQIGFNAGSFKLALLYHLIFGSGETISVGTAADTISRNFFGLEIGVVFGGGKNEKKPAPSNSKVTQE